MFVPFLRHLDVHKTHHLFSLNKFRIIKVMHFCRDISNPDTQGVVALLLRLGAGLGQQAPARHRLPLLLTLPLRVARVCSTTGVSGPWLDIETDWFSK